MPMVKSANGPTIDASLAREKNAETRNPRGIPVSNSARKNAKSTVQSVVGNTASCNSAVEKSATRKNTTTYVVACAAASAQLCRPMMDMSSRVLVSFSCTSPLISIPTGYSVDRHINRPKSGPKAS